MASHTDDSSVDGTVSSVGESTWDMIDEGSVVSEDIAYIPPRTPGSASEGLENIHVPQPNPARASDVKSASTDDSDQEDLTSDQVVSEPPQSPQATPVALNAQNADTSVYGIESSYTQEWMGTIRVDDTYELYPDVGISVASAKACTFEKEEARKHLSSRKDSAQVVPLIGRVHIGLKGGGLEVKDTFKLLYYGPKEMKAAITQKIGSALAANPRRPLLNDGPASSRVTVVPISSFMDESSPEVVMIESGGFDMIIEECIGAQLNESGGLTLDVESGNTIEYRMDQSNGRVGTQEISAPTGVPDLGIIYFPEKSVSSKRLSDEINSQNSYYLQLFFQRFGIPYYVITDTDWLDQPQMTVVGSYKFVPHRSVEALIDGDVQTWKELPIDITTFLALDASQLHDNLVALKSSAASTNPLLRDNTVPFATALRQYSKAVLNQTHGLADIIRQRDPRLWIPVAAALFVIVSISLLIPFYQVGSLSGLQQGSRNHEAIQINQAVLSKLSISKSQVDVQVLSTAPSLASLLAAETQRFSTLSQPARKKESAAVNRKGDIQSRSRDLLVRVFGDSHILIRSFKPSSGSSSLNVETRRNGKTLGSHVQKIDEEYLLLEIPSADAYGLIEIHIWTTVKPRYNETFEIDLGIPWLKMKGWKELAENAAQTTINEAREIQRRALQGLKLGRAAAVDLRKSEALIDAVSKLSTSLKDFEQAARGGSAKFLRRSISRCVRAQRKLAKVLRKAQQASMRQSGLVLEKQTRLNDELKELMHLVSERLLDQQERLAKAIGVLRKAAESQRFPRIHERQLRRAQKKLLQAWWKMRGRPA